MERDEIRLEVLKLCSRGGRTLTETLAEAEVFFEFITKKEELKDRTQLLKEYVSAPKKKLTDKLDILS